MYIYIYIIHLCSYTYIVISVYLYICLYVYICIYVRNISKYDAYVHMYTCSLNFWGLSGVWSAPGPLGTEHVGDSRHFLVSVRRFELEGACQTKAPGRGAVPSWVPRVQTTTI